MKRILALFLVMAAAGPAARGEEIQLPNLTPRRPYNIHSGAGMTSKGPALRFSLATINRNPYSLDVQGIGVPVADGDPVPATQCVQWAARACLARTEVGSFIWHEPHKHWHFDGFARYELHRMRGRRPDMRASAVVGTGRKVSFCLEDTEPASGEIDPQSLPQEPPLYDQCSPVMQGISPGWADVYDSTVEGQEVPLARVPDGVYALVITVNPDRTLRESTYADNVTWLRVRIARYGKYTEVSVVR